MKIVKALLIVLSISLSGQAFSKEVEATLINATGAPIAYVVERFAFGVDYVPASFPILNENASEQISLNTDENDFQKVRFFQIKPEISSAVNEVAFDNLVLPGSDYYIPSGIEDQVTLRIIKDTEGKLMVQTVQ